MKTESARDPLARVVDLHERVQATSEANAGALVRRDLAIRHAVTVAGVSQADVARATGLTRTRVAQIVNGVPTTPRRVDDGNEQARPAAAG